MNIEKEREGFEEWAKSVGFTDFYRFHDGYMNPEVDYSWEGWQARAALAQGEKHDNQD